MSAKQVVLVTGATGNQGGAVAEHLLRRGHHVRAFVRDPDSPRAQHLRALGAQLATGDYADPDSLVAAARGAHALFALATPFEAGVDAEVQQGRTLVDCARRAEVRHFIYSSVANADRDTGIPHFESKHMVELYLRKSGLPFTIVGPANFRENFLGELEEMAATGEFSMPIEPDRPLQSICRDDLGAFVTHVVEAGAALLGQRIDIASDSTTGPQMAEAFSLAVGRPVRYVARGVREVLSSDEDMGLMWAWFNRVGYSADIPRLRREFRDVGWRSFADWARGLAR